MRLFDKDGNVLPNTYSGDSSENPSLFNCAYHFMLEERVEAAGETYDQANHLKQLNRRKWFTNGRYMTNDNDVHKVAQAAIDGERSPDRFSLDEAIAVAASSRRYKHYENLSKVELFGRSYSLRPDTFSYLLLCKFPIFNLFLIPRFMVALSMLIACMRKPSDTSGKQLTYIRYKGLNMRWTWWLCSKVLTNKSWLEVFQIYYPDKQSLIRTSAEIVFKENL